MSDQKPVVVDQLPFGKEKQYTIYVCRVPGPAFAFVQVHNSWKDDVKVDPKTKEIDLPGAAAWNLKAPPEGFIVMGLRGVISLFEKK